MNFAVSLINPAHCLVALTLWMAGATSAWAAWPAYRHDAQRSGISVDEIKLPLTEAWMHRSAAPNPAWPELPAKQDVYRRVANLGPTTTYDRAFQVAAAGGAIYYGSSADDTVRCLDASDGASAGRSPPMVPCGWRRWSWRGGSLSAPMTVGSIAFAPMTAVWCGDIAAARKTAVCRATTG